MGPPGPRWAPCWPHEFCYLGRCRLRVGWSDLSPPSAAYMRQWTGSALLQVMACRLFGDKPLPEPMLAYCQLGSWEQISVKLESEFFHFRSRKCIWNCRLPQWRPFYPGGDELKVWLSMPRVPLALDIPGWVATTTSKNRTTRLPFTRAVFSNTFRKHAYIFR